MICSRLQELLKLEGAMAEEAALRYIAKAADGAMRDALSLLDQCMAFYMGQKLTYEKVLDVLGAADEEVFRTLFLQVSAQDEPVCHGLYLAFEEPFAAARLRGCVSGD